MVDEVWPPIDCICILPPRLFFKLLESRIIEAGYFYYNATGATS